MSAMGAQAKKLLTAGMSKGSVFVSSKGVTFPTLISPSYSPLGPPSPLQHPRGPGPDFDFYGPRDYQQTLGKARSMSIHFRDQIL